MVSLCVLYSIGRTDVDQRDKEEGKRKLTTNTMTFDLLRKFLNHVNLSSLCLTLFEPLHHLGRPGTAFSTRRALPATLVLVKLAQPGDHPDHVGRLVHDDDRGRAQAGLAVLEGVKVHQLVVADVFRQDRRRRASGDDGLEVVPAAAHASAVLLDQLAQRDRHLLLDRARVVDVSRDAEELRALVSFPPEPGEPLGPPAGDGRAHGHRLDVGHGRRAPEEADGGGEGGLQARLAGLSLQRLDQRRLLAAHVRAHAAVEVDVKVVTRAAGVLADQTFLVRFLDRPL